MDFQESKSDSGLLGKQNVQWTSRKPKGTVDFEEIEMDSRFSGKQKGQWVKHALLI